MRVRTARGARRLQGRHALNSVIAECAGAAAMAGSRALSFCVWCGWLAAAGRPGGGVGRGRGLGAATRFGGAQGREGAGSGWGMPEMAACCPGAGARVLHGACVFWSLPVRLSASGFGQPLWPRLMAVWPDDGCASTALPQLLRRTFFPWAFHPARKRAGTPDAPIPRAARKPAFAVLRCAAG